MRWNRTGQSLDFNCPIDNTGLDVIRNLVNTGVSDYCLKTNIQNIDANYSDCIKNVKLKTFEFKNKKYNSQDKYGIIAQELLEHLPKEFKNIIRENQPKNKEEKEYLTINYMKLSIVLWECCQEILNKVEHLEASIYKIMAEIKELKGKKAIKPKAKAKSKAKTKAEK